MEISILNSPLSNLPLRLSEAFCAYATQNVELRMFISILNSLFTHYLLVDDLNFQFYILVLSSYSHYPLSNTNYCVACEQIVSILNYPFSCYLREVSVHYQFSILRPHECRHSLFLILNCHISCIELISIRSSPF